MSQVGYGSNDVVGAPGNVIQAIASQAITMTSGRLTLNNAASVASLALTLPLNPPDGAVAEIVSLGGATTITVAANTGDAIAGAAAVTALTASVAVEYAYTLNGSQNGNAAPVNARTWFRTR
jgi:hypothetical protein